MLTEGKLICYVCILRWKPLNTVCDTPNRNDCVFCRSLYRDDMNLQALLSQTRGNTQYEDVLCKQYGRLCIFL